VLWGEEVDKSKRHGVPIMLEPAMGGRFPAARSYSISFKGGPHTGST
jgi:hypothetical protein